MKAEPTWKTYVDKRRQDENQGQGREAPQRANATFESEAFAFFTTSQLSNQSKIQDTIPLDKRWVVDTGAQVHICNDRELFVTFESVRSSVRVGDTETRAVGEGTVVIYGVSPTTGNPIKMELYDVKYSPQFHSNLLPHGLMMKRGVLANVRSNWIETIQDQRPLGIAWSLVTRTRVPLPAI